MKRLLLSAATGLVCAVSLFAASERSDRADPAVFLDGKHAYSVRTWSGGGLRVTLNETGGASSNKKNVGKVSLTPLQLEAVLPLEPGLLAHVDALCRGQFPTATLTLGKVDRDSLAPKAREVRNAILTEVVFRIGDGTQNPARAILTFQPGEIRDITNASGRLDPPRADADPLLRNFSLTIDGVVDDRSSSQVFQVGDIRISRPFDGSGGAVGKTVFANISLRVMGENANWIAWRESFLVQGQNGDQHEKSGTLRFLDFRNKAGLTLALNHAGLAGFETIPGNQTKDAVLAVELYVEEILPQGAGATGTANAGSSNPSATATPAGSGGTTSQPAPSFTKGDSSSEATSQPKGGDDQVRASGKGESGTSSTKGAADEVGGATKGIGTTEKDAPPPTKAGAAPGEIGGAEKGLTTTEKGDSSTTKAGAAPGEISTSDKGIATSEKDAPASRAGTKSAPPEKPPLRTPTFTVMKNPADKGSRDPAGVPRADDAIRQSYAMNKGKGYSQEVATYTSARPLDELADYYDKELTSAGWAADRRLENDYGVNGTHQVISTFNQGKDVCTVTLTQTKPNEVTITLRVDRVIGT